MKKNQKLAGLFSLSHNIKVFIPSKIGHEEINKDCQKEHVLRTIELFSTLFGGATSYKGIGGWMSITDGLVTEKICVVESYGTTEQVESGLDTILNFCQQLKAELKQENIALEYNNRLYFI